MILLYIIFLCISHFFFFANDLLLAVYFTLILNYELMLDKKQIWVAFFLFKFKKGRKALETTCNINNAFGSGTANAHYVKIIFLNTKKTQSKIQTCNFPWLDAGVGFLFVIFCFCFWSERPLRKGLRSLQLGWVSSR